MKTPFTTLDESGNTTYQASLTQQLLSLKEHVDHAVARCTKIEMQLTQNEPTASERVLLEQEWRQVDQTRNRLKKQQTELKKQLDDLNNKKESTQKDDALAKLKENLVQKKLELEQKLSSNYKEIVNLEQDLNYLTNMQPFTRNQRLTKNYLSTIMLGTDPWYHYVMNNLNYPTALDQIKRLGSASQIKTYLVKNLSETDRLGFIAHAPLIVAAVNYLEHLLHSANEQEQLQLKATLSEIKAVIANSITRLFNHSSTAK
ncbi:MAG: hypothetical protein RLZ12_500 [Bacillota bacterium]